MDAGGWGYNLASSWAEASKDDEWRLLCRFWCHRYQSTSWLNFPAAVYTPAPPLPHPGKAIWVAFQFLHHINIGYISSSRSTEVDGSRSQVVCFFFFFLSPLNFRCDAGVRAARPSPQDSPPSAPATASTSVATMREAHNLQDVSQLMCVLVCCGSRTCTACVVAHALICGPAVTAMHEALTLKLFCRWHLFTQAKQATLCSRKKSKRHGQVIFITPPFTSTANLSILQSDEWIILHSTWLITLAHM